MDFNGYLVGEPKLGLFSMLRVSNWACTPHGEPQDLCEVGLQLREGICGGPWTTIGAPETRFVWAKREWSGYTTCGAVASPPKKGHVLVGNMTIFKAQALAITGNKHPEGQVHKTNSLMLTAAGPQLQRQHFELSNFQEKIQIPWIQDWPKASTFLGYQEKHE